MSECNEMKRLRREESNARLAGQESYAMRVKHTQRIHWDGCSECQGVEAVPQPIEHDYTIFGETR